MSAQFTYEIDNILMAVSVSASTITGTCDTKLPSPHILSEIDDMLSSLTNAATIRRRNRRRRATILSILSGIGTAFFLLHATNDTALGGPYSTQSNLRRALQILEEPATSGAVAAAAAAAADENNPSKEYKSQINFYIKTSGEDAHIALAKRIAETWGRDAVTQTSGGPEHTMTFLEDDSIPSPAVDNLEHEYPWLTFERVDGTVCDGGADCVRSALRSKTRQVFETYSKEGLADAGKSSWVCYLDDDISVNVENLRSELDEIHQECSPNCFIADAPKIGGAEGYSVPSSGWCMERDLALRIQNLLSTRSDEDLDWLGNDDVSFSMMLKNELGVSVTDSSNWYSYLSRPILHSNSHKVVKRNEYDPDYYNLKRFPRLSWNSPLLETFVLTLSVMNVVKENPANSIIIEDRQVHPLHHLPVAADRKLEDKQKRQLKRPIHQESLVEPELPLTVATR